METRPAILLARPVGLAKYLAQAAAGRGQGCHPRAGLMPLLVGSEGSQVLAKRPWVGCVLLTQDKEQADPSPERRPSINTPGFLWAGVES